MLIYVLLGAAAITAAMQHWVDTGVILAVVLANAAIGFIQEGKAEAAMAAIRGMLAPQAAVLRDGTRVSVDGASLVPGDIVLLAAGDNVPADLRIFEVRGLAAQEAILAGKSIPVEKMTDPVEWEGQRRKFTLEVHVRSIGAEQVPEHARFLDEASDFRVPRATHSARCAESSRIYPSATSEEAAVEQMCDVSEQPKGILEMTDFTGFRRSADIARAMQRRQYVRAPWPARPRLSSEVSLQDGHRHVAFRSGSPFKETRRI